VSNYVLSIQLEGADKADAALDSLLAKVGKLSSGSVDFSLDKAIDDSGILKSGEGMGEELSKGIKKGVKKNLSGNWLGLTGEFGAAVQRAVSPLNKFWEDAIKRGQKGLPEQPMQGPDLSGDLRRKFWKIKGLPEPGGKDLSKISNLPSIEDLQKGIIKGLPEPGGKDLAKVQMLPDIGKILEDEAKAKKLDWGKIFTGVALGFTNPYIGSRVLSDELGKKLNASGGGIAGGLFGKGGIAGFSEIFLAFKSFKIAVDIFKYAARLFNGAVKQADKFYSNALQNGMGAGFSIRRGTLAQIMGVSEQDVFRFGAQMAYLNPKIEWASKILTETNKPLTEVSWNMKVLKLDISAMVSKLANDAAPAVLRFVESLDKLVKFLGNNYKLITDPTGIKSEQEKYKDAVAVANKATGGAGMPFTDQRKLWNDALKNALALGSKVQSGMPSTESWMKQLPASHWEKMGLIMGPQSQNYAKQTAKNTGDMAKGIAIIAKHYIGKNGANLGNFGMSPNVAQP